MICRESYRDAAHDRERIPRVFDFRHVPVNRETGNYEL
jgi:hypothetical protein